jgi:tRNA modification GTPase
MGDPIEIKIPSKPIPEDTICAISTPIGESGIGMVRVSGMDAVGVSDRVYRSPSGLLLSKVTSHSVHFGWIVDPASGLKIDEVLVTVMRGPRTYTREDTVEITCHGGPLPLRRILESLLSSGARLADPGEFTKRAFLNGRIDLTQAEAVMDIIRSKTEIGLDLAMRQLSGHLGQKIHGLKERLVHLLSGIEASIDFSEEGLEFGSREEVRQTLEEISQQLQDLIATADDGRIVREGISVTIIGRPNVGKSSLLNSLLQEDRAIVTPIPGTTRDLVEEYVNIEGIPVRLTDTAGMRDTSDPIEVEGVRRTHQAVDRAELLLQVLDRSAPLEDEDHLLLKRFASKSRILVINKIDLPERWAPHQVPAIAEEGFCLVSSQTGEGCDQLRLAIASRTASGHLPSFERTLITNVRQKQSCVKALESVTYCLVSIGYELSGELLAPDLRGAIHHLGLITGETTTEDILDALFNDFCIGK